jgi:hypothetical protein
MPSWSGQHNQGSPGGSSSSHQTQPDPSYQRQVGVKQAVQQGRAPSWPLAWLLQASGLFQSRSTRVTTGSTEDDPQASKTGAGSAPQLTEPGLQEAGVTLVSVQGSSSVTISGIKLLGASTASLVVSNSTDVRVTGVTVHTSSQAIGTYGGLGMGGMGWATAYLSALSPARQAEH